MPKVSVVVPVYNAERFLAQCLDSLLAQTFQDLEILCVNDGSTDRSLEILEEYSTRDGRLKVFTKENEGKGAAPARNLGLSSAAGGRILFLIRTVRNISSRSVMWWPGTNCTGGIFWRTTG